MLITGLFDRGAMPATERLLQFTTQRHRVLTHNIANLSTPFFRPRDLDPDGFQAALGRAIDERRRSDMPLRGPLPLRDTREITFGADGIQARAAVAHHNLMFHDRNDRDLERTMQHLAENTMTHQVAVELLRNQFDMMRTALRERVTA